MYIFFLRGKVNFEGRKEHWGKKGGTEKGGTD